MKRIRLGPGGKVLMVVAGLGLIGLGLSQLELFQGLASASREAAAPGAPGLDPARLAPPPLELPPGANSAYPDLERGCAGAGELAALGAGKAEVAAVPLESLVLREGPEIMIVGARPAAQRLLCAASDPLLALQYGAAVRAPLSGDRLLVGHLAEVLGLDAGGLRFTDGPGLEVVDEAGVGLPACVSLSGTGARPPCVLVVRAGEAKELAPRLRRLATPEGLAFLAAPAGDPSGFVYRESYLRSLAERMLGRTAPPAPLAPWLRTAPESP